MPPSITQSEINNIFYQIIMIWALYLFLFSIPWRNDLIKFVQFLKAILTYLHRVALVFPTSQFRTTVMFVLSVTGCNYQNGDACRVMIFTKIGQLMCIMWMSRVKIRGKDHLRGPVI